MVIYAMFIHCEMGWLVSRCSIVLRLSLASCNSWLSFGRIMKKVHFYVVHGPSSPEWTCVVPADTEYDKVIMKCLKETGWKFATATIIKTIYLEGL